MTRPDYDFIDARPASILVGCSPQTALRIRVALIRSEIADEWRRWAATDDQRAAIEAAMAAVDGILPTIKEKT